MWEKLRRGEGPFWGKLKRTILSVMSFHIPVNGITRPVFRLCYRFHVFVRETWVWARRFLWNEPLFRSQCESIGTRFRMEELPYITNSGRIVIGDRVLLSGRSSMTFGRVHDSVPELLIGSDTFIGHGCSFHIGKSITIGNHCLLAAGVTIYDMDGHPLDANSRRAGEPSPPDSIKPVTIEDDVWVGSGSIILKGVTIGSRSVIAARSVVTQDVPADSIVAGNPARLIRQMVPTEIKSGS